MSEFSPTVIIAVALIILATLSLLAAFGWWLGGVISRRIRVRATEEG